MSYDNYDPDPRGDEPPPPWQGQQGSSRRPNGPRQSGPPPRRSSAPRRQGSAPDLGSYVEVKDRIKMFYQKYPEGRLQSEVVEGLSHIQSIEEVEVTKVKDGKTVTQTESIAIGYIAVKAYAYRTPDDPRPATGLSAMLMPGTTPYTRGSELENAETSAWGRALANLDILNEHSIASRDEVNKARGDDDVDAEIAAAEAFAAAQAAQTTSGAAETAQAGDLTAVAAEILGAVPVPVTGEAPPLAGEAPAAPETATDTPAAPEPDGEAPAAEPVGMDEQTFLDQIRGHFIHSSVVNRVRIALFPATRSYKDLTDIQRAVLFDGCLEAIRQDTKD